MGEIFQVVPCSVQLVSKTILQFVNSIFHFYHILIFIDYINSYYYYIYIVQELGVEAINRVDAIYACNVK